MHHQLASKRRIRMMRAPIVGVHEINGLLRRFVKREVITANSAIYDLDDLSENRIRGDAVHPPTELLRLVQDAFERHKRRLAADADV